MTEPIDLGKLNEQLNQLSNLECSLNKRLCCPEFRKDLFEDPVKVLKQEGVVLDAANEKNVVELFKSAKIPVDKDLLLTSAVKPDGVFISIGIRF